MQQKYSYVYCFVISLMLTACVGGHSVQSPSVASSESTSVSNAVLPPQIDPKTSAIDSNAKAWAGAVFLFDNIAVRELLPLKTHCGSQTLSWKYTTEWPYELETVLLNPGSVDLFTSTTLAKFYDLSFSQDCTEIYVIGDTQRMVSSGSYLMDRDIYAYNIAKHSWKTISHDLAPGGESIDTAKPAPVVIYPLSNEELFVYAHNLTTGRDAYTDQTSKGIYNIQEGTVHWIENGGGLPPPVFQPAKMLLSVFSTPSDSQSGYSLVRTDILLPQGTKQHTVLHKDEDFDTLVGYLWEQNSLCIRVNFDSAHEYAECMDRFWAHAFPDVQ